MIRSEGFTIALMDKLIAAWNESPEAFVKVYRKAGKEPFEIMAVVNRNRDYFKPVPKRRSP